jgi:hypothetical protein
MEAHLLVGFPEAVFFEERRLEFEAAFAWARGLRQGSYAEHGGGSQFPRPIKRVHGLIIAKRSREMPVTEIGPVKVACVKSNTCGNASGG